MTTTTTTSTTTTEEPTTNAVFTWQTGFLGERDLVNYSPTFNPNTVTFDPIYNIPTIRCGTTDRKLQILHDNAWVNLNWSEPWQNRAVDERVVYDSDGWAYYIHNGYLFQETWTTYLYYSKDYSSKVALGENPTWESPINLGSDLLAKLEHRDGYNNLNYPPSLILYYNSVHVDYGKFYLGILSKNAQDELSLITHTLSENSVYASSGRSNVTVSFEDKIYCVWPNDDGEGHHTPQYISVYDRATNILHEPYLIHKAEGGDPSSSVANSHCVPGICLDASGRVHVITGAHNNKMFHFVGTCDIESAESIWSFSEPIDIGLASVIDGYDRDNSGILALTYVSCCYVNNTLHLVARCGRADKHDRKMFLVHLKGTTTDNENWTWPCLSELIIPSNYIYNHYYQSLNIDSNGYLYFSYWHYTHYLSGSNEEGAETLEYAAYINKWPGDNLVRQEGPHILWNGETYYYYTGAYPQEPCVYVSKDNGDSWEIADFLTEITTTTTSTTTTEEPILIHATAVEGESLVFKSPGFIKTSKEDYLYGQKQEAYVKRKKFDDAFKKYLR